MKKSILLLFVLIIYASAPSGGEWTLTMGTFSGGGASDAEHRSSTSYKMTDNLGDGSKTSETPFVSESYVIYGGFRNVDLDLRPPLVDVIVPDSISSSAMIYVSWFGVDTTLEDGEGWGIWKYDVQWSKSSEPGVWHDWHIGTELTNSWFGPLDPVEVKEDTFYYFRARGYDLARNVSEYPETPHDSVVFNAPVIALRVEKAGEDTIWITDTTHISRDVISDEPNIFIVKNRGTEHIDLGIYSYNTNLWRLADNPGLNTYGLRAIFNLDPHPPLPAEFDELTIVRAGYANLTFASPDTFGPGGFNLAPVEADSLDRTTNLWLQVKTPTAVTRFRGYDNEMILIKMEARNSIY